MPSYNNNGGWGYASRQGDGSTLPEKLWCYLGRHDASSNRFSKNQLAQYYNAKRRQGKVNDKHLKMICRDHSGEPALQLKCMGPCHRLLARTKFSRNQRVNQLRWCQQCVKWRTQLDYDTVPNAPPNGIVSPGETEVAASGSEFTPLGSLEMDESFSRTGQHSIVDEDDTDNEDDATDFQSSSVHRGPALSDDDSDDDEDFTGYAGYSSFQVATDATTSSADPLSAADVTRSITSHMSSLAFDDGQASQSSASNFQTYNQSSSTSGSRAAPTMSRPGALRNFDTGSTGNVSTVMASETTSQQAPSSRPGVRAPYLPPHLRDDDGDYYDPFSASNAPSVLTDDYGTGSRSVTSSSQDAGRPSAGRRQFNAYGPDGQLQRRDADANSVQTRSSVNSATTTSGPAGYGTRRRPDKGNWARPDMRKKFEHKVTFATTNNNIVDIYDSGSEDEI